MITRVHLEFHLRITVDSTLAKRKRTEDPSDNDSQSDLTELEPSGTDNDINDAATGDDSDAPQKKSKPKATRKQVKGAPAAKRVRTKPPAKASSGDPKPKKSTAGRRGRKPAASRSQFDAAQVAKDTRISGDCALFSEFGVSCLCSVRRTIFL